MNTLSHTPGRAKRTLATLFAASFLTGIPVAMQGCDKDVSVSKTTKTKTTDTPDGVKKTTETTEKKTEVEHKNQN